MPSIIAGKRRGASLSVPSGGGVRPTLARVREALFSMIYSEFGGTDGLRVLDPFAGAGLLGLEAWSRGAAHVDMMECDRVHFGLLERNILSLGAGGGVTARLGRSPRDWGRFGRHAGYDLVLCDPPYASGILPETLDALLAPGVLAPGAVVSVEIDAGADFALPGRYCALRDRNYGRCRIILAGVKVS